MREGIPCGDTMSSKFSVWSGRISAFAVQLAIVGVLLHRFTGMSTPVAMNLFMSAFVLAALAVVIGVIAYVGIWRRGGEGFGRATFGILMGGILLAWPGTYLPKFITLPVINDVSTDTSSPPRFVHAVSERPQDANPVMYPGGKFANEQRSSYPDIKPLIVKYSRARAFDTARMIMKKREWAIVDEKRPGKGVSTGKIEAVQRTLVLGFPDDIVVRIGGDKGRAKIDVRSASRYGRHDFGRNAERIRGFLKELHARLDAGEDLNAGGDASSPALLSQSDKKKRLKKKAARKKYAPKRRASRYVRKRKVWRRLRKQRRYRYKPFPVY